MPGYRAHLVGGAVACGLTLFLLKSYCSSVLVAAEWIMFSFAGSLFPDVDTKSKGQKLLYRFLFITLIVLALQQNFMPMAVLSIVAVVPLVVKHRGLFHKFWFVVGLPVGVAGGLAMYAPSYAANVGFDTVFFVAGAVSHLFLDFVVKR